MLANSILVTGCDKGIGLEFINQLKSLTCHLFAGCFYPEQATELHSITSANKHIALLHMDVTNEESIQKAVHKIEAIVGEEGLNCVINNAGILHFMNSIENLTSESMVSTYSVNAIGPLSVVKACINLLTKASGSFNKDERSSLKAAIINISSDFGSMDGSPAFNRDEKLFYSYRCSKISLNMLVKNLSIDLREKGMLTINLNPGWVKTDMGGSEGPQTREETVEKLIDIISKINLKSELFYNWNGEPLPW